MTPITITGTLITANPGDVVQLPGGEYLVDLALPDGSVVLESSDTEELVELSPQLARLLGARLLMRNRHEDPTKTSSAATPPQEASQEPTGRHRCGVQAAFNNGQWEVTCVYKGIDIEAVGDDLGAILQQLQSLLELELDSWDVALNVEATIANR